jgi:cytochrome d ubiquinol oxidase subunit II
MTTVWYCILVLGLSMYAILDGFDLGVGILYLWIARNNTERRMVQLAIGPVWDGNEVWLVAGAGLLVLSFPRVYAAGFSGFYLPLILVLWLLMTRGLSLEWRHNVDNPLWRAAADVLFAWSSLLLAFVFGVAVGNVVNGVPVDPQGYYQGLFRWILNPYALLVGVFGVIVLATHGANWLALKTEGPVQARARRISLVLWPVLVLFAIVSTIGTFVARYQMNNNYHDYPIYYLVPALTVVLLGALLYFRRQNQDLRAFLASAALILSVGASTGIGLYPDLLPSQPHAERSFTIYNSASNSLALQSGLTWLAIGLALAIVHIGFSYYLFRGKVVLDEHSHY